MGFFSGRVAFTRFRVAGPSPGMFGPEHLERLAAHSIGRQRLTSADGVEAGWTAGDHILDTAFDLAKNVVNDALHFALRVDAQKIPADLLRAYTLVELQALAAGNPSGQPSNRQRREARQAARDRLEVEAADGRFLRRKAYPLLWDAPSNELLVGGASAAILDRLHSLFVHTFGRGFEAFGAGRQAFSLAEPRQQTRGVDDASLSPFLGSTAPATVAWLPDEDSRDFLGNEFLLWLWYYLDSEDDTIPLADGSDVTLMFARSLVLECPRAQTGRQSITSDAPTRLPEARRALQAGKLPRRAGLVLVRHEQQYELTLHAETLAVSGGRLPAVEGDSDRARLEARVSQLRELLETLDLLYDAFGRRRFGADWSKELAKVQKWLQQEDRARFSATA
jgi:hypothetical protein